MNVEALNATRTALTNRRNVEPDPARRVRLTILVNNVDGLIKDPSPELAAQFRKNYAGFMAGRA